MTTLKYGVDAPKVRESDAVRIMLHHLALAAAYFEATPDTTIQALAELPDTFEGSSARALGPARDWYLAMVKTYEDADAPA